MKYFGIERGERLLESPHDAYIYFESEAETDVSPAMANLGSLVLSAIDVEMIDNEEGYTLLTALADNRINVSQKQSFAEIIHSHLGLVNDRLRTITSAGARGALTSEDVMNEFTQLRYYDPTSEESMAWISKDGFYADLSEDGDFIVRTDEFYSSLEEFSGSDSREFNLAKELGLNNFALQSEVIQGTFGRPKVLSDREHISLGTTDEQTGEYTPFVTVLEDSHPVVANKN